MSITVGHWERIQSKKKSFGIRKFGGRGGRETNHLLLRKHLEVGEEPNAGGTKTKVKFWELINRKKENGKNENNKKAERQKGKKTRKEENARGQKGRMTKVPQPKLN